MQIERVIGGIKTLGPGERLVIWVNGCNRRCKNCVSARLQAFNPDNDQNVVALLNGFDLKHVDGVTISGGEPFEQYYDLWLAVKFLKESGIDDILIYSGYTYSELKNKLNPIIDKILTNIAVLIDGPYIDDLNDDTGNMKGSKNQNIIYLNPEYEEKYTSYYKETREMQEFRIGNYIISAGIPTKAYIQKFVSDSDAQGEKNGRN